MKVKIGKYIDDNHVLYTTIDINCPPGHDHELDILALTDSLDDLLNSNSVCTLEEFHKDGDVYMYTESQKHIKDFDVTRPFWIIVEKSGFFWNLNALMKHIYKLDMDL